MPSADLFVSRMNDTPTCGKCGATDLMWDGGPHFCRRCRNVGGPVYRQEKWDRRYLELAEFVAKWSKDPSTKTGAVIIDAFGKPVSFGFNGFAQGTDDSPERYADRVRKIASVIHCEENAIFFADRDRLRGATLYTYPFMSCAKCAGAVVQVGIKRCVAPVLPPHLEERWGANIAIARKDFADAGVELCELDLAV
jgi:dCMP deaminase